MCVVVSCQGQHLTTAMLHSLDGTVFAFGRMFWECILQGTAPHTEIVICASCFALVNQQDNSLVSTLRLITFAHSSTGAVGINTYRSQ